MYVPRVRSGFEVPRRLITGFAGTCAVLTAILVAALFTRSTSDEAAFSAVPALPDFSPGAVVYSATSAGYDVVYVRDVEGGRPARKLASFPVSLIGLHVRGATSASGGHVAVLSLENGSGPEAKLTLVSLASIDNRTVDGTFDYLSRITWSPDSSSLVLTQRTQSADPNRGFALVEIATASLERKTLHVFETALAVSPIGHAVDGRLLVVVVSQEGSSLWAHADGETAVVSKFSPGLTSDWSLSPDGSRVAFIDHLGAGKRIRAGRVLSVATGKVTDFAQAGEQLGAAWRPGAAAPDFGGPDGSVGLSGAEPGSYLVPLSWTPDGNYLVATVVGPASDGGAPSEKVEIVSRTGRIPLTEGEHSRFLGLVPGG